MKKKNILYIFLILIIFLLGFIFRLKAYLTCRSLWLDEMFLFHNIYEKSFLGLFSKLIWQQSAPPLFLVVEKIIVSIFGIKELSLRLLPFLCSLVSIPVFYLFSKSILNKKLSILIANGLFAINLYIIFYSQEFKQYSTDVLFLMLLFLFFKDLSIKNDNIKNSLKYIAVTMISPFISLISYFPISAWLIRETIITKAQCLKKMFIINIPLIILSIYYYIAMLKPQMLEIMRVSSDYWHQGYLSFNIHNNIAVIKNIILYIFKPCNSAIILFSFIFFGMCILIKNFKRKEILLFLIIFAETLLFSFLHIYPVFERASLFMIPVVIIMVAACFDICDTHTLVKKLCSLTLIIIFLISFHNYDYKYLKNRFNGKVKSYSNPRLMMQILRKKYKSGDTVIISLPSKAEYLYYKLYFNFEPKKERYTHNILPTKEEHLKDLDKLTKSGKNYWFFYSIDYTEDKTVNNALKEWKNKYKVLYEKNNIGKYNNSYILYLRK